MLYELMAPYQERTLSECFNPSGAFTVTEVFPPEDPGGRLDIFQHELSEDPQLRTERIALVKKYHHQDYFIKAFGIDLGKNEEIRDYVSEHYQLIAIERRDTFDTVLSGLISNKHEFFNNYKRKDLKSIYKPFIANYQIFDYMATCLKHYYEYKSLLNITKTFIYEDIVLLDRNSILLELGLEPSSNPRLPLQKLLDFESKTRLIENYEEVLFWYKTDLKPFLPKDRQGGY